MKRNQLVSAGAQILLRRCGGTEDELERLFVAGAFGNNLNLDSARRIGLIPVAAERAHPVGNAALRGAKMALFDPDGETWQSARRLCEHAPLASDREFMDTYVAEMSFPESACAAA